MYIRQRHSDFCMLLGCFERAKFVAYVCVYEFLKRYLTINFITL